MTEAEALALQARLQPASSSPLPDVVRRLVEPARDRDGLRIVAAVPVGVTAFPPGSIVVEDARGMRYVRTPRGELRRQATKPRSDRRKL